MFSLSNTLGSQTQRYDLTVKMKKSHRPSGKTPAQETKDLGPSCQRADKLHMGETGQDRKQTDGGSVEAC